MAAAQGGITLPSWCEMHITICFTTRVTGPSAVAEQGYVLLSDASAVQVNAVAGYLVQGAWR